MKKLSIKILTAFLIPAVSLTAVLCCSFIDIKPAAASVKTEKLPPCHAKKETPVPDQRDCGCCKDKKIQADIPHKLSFDGSHELSQPLSYESHPAVILAADKILTVSINGPPGPVSDTPLYITFRNFRI